MTDEAMSPLRRRMIEDMTIRKLGRKTQQDYVQIIKKLAAFLGRSPDTATFEDLRRFLPRVGGEGRRRTPPPTAPFRTPGLFSAPAPTIHPPPADTFPS